MKKADKEEFLDLVEDVSSPVGGTRVLARLRMRAFVEKHGREACDKVFRESNSK